MIYKIITVSFIEANQVCISNEAFSSGSKIKDSWFGEDSNCEGKVVSSSIGRGVQIGNKASVKNSVILEDVIIEDGCQIDGCLIGKSAIITKDTRKTNEIINHFSKI